MELLVDKAFIKAKIEEAQDVDLDAYDHFDEGYWQGLDKALDIVNEAPTIPQWHRCEDEMPNHDDSVLCCGGRGGVFVGKVCTNSGTQNGRAAVVLPNGNVRYCTHWMPLPELPKEE